MQKFRNKISQRKSMTETQIKQSSFKAKLQIQKGNNGMGTK